MAKRPLGSSSALAGNDDLDGASIAASMRVLAQGLPPGTTAERGRPAASQEEQGRADNVHPLKPAASVSPAAEIPARPAEPAPARRGAAKAVKADAELTALAGEVAARGQTSFRLTNKLRLAIRIREAETNLSFQEIVLQALGKDGFDVERDIELSKAAQWVTRRGPRTE